MKVLVKLTSVRNDNLMASVPAAGCCHAAELFKQKQSDFQIQNPAGFSLKEGSFAEVEIKDGLATLSSFLLFILPLIFFVAGYFIADALGFKDDRYRAFGGLIGAVFSFLIAYLINRLFLRSKMPVIGKVFDNDLSELPCNGNCDACTGSAEKN